jgi:hypothetical protein
MLRTRSSHPQNRHVEKTNPPRDRLSGGSPLHVPRGYPVVQNASSRIRMEKAVETHVVAPPRLNPSRVPKRFGYQLLHNYHPLKSLSRLFFVDATIAPFDTFSNSATAGTCRCWLHAKTFWDFC